MKSFRRKRAFALEIDHLITQYGDDDTLPLGWRDALHNVADVIEKEN